MKNSAARRPHQPARRTIPLTPYRSEEAELLRAVADEQVLGLLVVIQHHLVGLAADTRLLVATERGVRRIGVVAIGPDPARLDGAAEPVQPAGIAAPDTGAETVERVVGDRQRLVVVELISRAYSFPQWFEQQAC